MPFTATESTNLDVFRECFSEPVLRHLATPAESPKKKSKGKRRSGGKASNLRTKGKTEVDAAEAVIKKRAENGSWADPSGSERARELHLSDDGEKDEHESSPTNVGDVEDLSDFIDYLAEGIFSDLPADLRSLSYHSSQDLKTAYSPPLSTDTVIRILAPVPTHFAETLYTYFPSVASDPTFFETFLSPALTSYIESVTQAPPPPSLTKDAAEGCEICLRHHIPLTYHHLIPKSVHDKVVKRGWHEEWQLNDVAWLCRQCHSFVHRISGNEELAREWFTVARLMEREDVQRWAKWCGGVRWKKR